MPKCMGCSPKVRKTIDSTSVGHGLPAATEIPRFDDGMANIQELIRIMAEALANEITGAQAEGACADGNQRNGYRERAPVAGVGVVNLRIPKLGRGSCFPGGLLVRYSRAGRAAIAAVSEMATCGVSARKAERIAAQMGMGRMSSSQVSRICGALDATTADLRERDLPDTALPRIWVDETYTKRRDEGHAPSCAPVTAMGAGADGYRRLPGSGAIDAEPHAGRPAFARSLGERGADGVACVASDAHEGPRRAVEEALPGAAWRRRTVRLVGNAASLAPARQKRAAALAIPHAAFAERDPSPVRGLCRLACRGICSLRPKAAELLEEAEADALAYLDLPCARHRRLRASNVQERANRELERRSRVVQVSPSGKSLIRMLGAAFSEVDEDRATRRWLTGESIARALAPAKLTAPAPACEGTAEEHARRVIDVVVADNPIGGKAA